MNKRVSLRMLEQHDAHCGTSLVRALEMDMDSLIRTPGYSKQFWEDVRLYGLREAYFYAKKHLSSETEAIKAINRVAVEVVGEAVLP